MKRYISEGEWQWNRGIDSLSRTVHEEEKTTVATKLLDKDGNRIFSVTDVNPIGFIWRGKS